MPKRLLIVDVAALAHRFDDWAIQWHAMETVFPAVTSAVQASFRTASLPSSHGMVANGLFCRHLRKVMFWEQSAGLVAGRRIWEGFRARGGKVGMLFWQQSLGEQADVILSPAPIHKHHGGMIQDCYSRPAGLYGRLCRRVGRPFNLMHYWGPLASSKSGQWIADATAALLNDSELAPELCLTYLPTLDYDLQRFGPGSPQAARAVSAIKGQLELLNEAARQAGYEIVIFGDYAMAPVSAATFPNRALAQAGLLATRTVKDRLYPDLYTSRAFAVVDHQVAHVYVAEPDDIEKTAVVLSQVPGVEKVMTRPEQAESGIDHANGGELVLLAAEGTWFAYPWWTDSRRAPDYARHVDIHNKPGYDPCELFFGWPPLRVSQDTGKVRGSHGRTGPGREVAWASTVPLGEVKTLIDLAAAVGAWLDDKA